MAKLSAAELEAIHRAAKVYLAERPTLPMALNAIHGQLTSDGHRVTPDDLKQELEIMAGDGWIKITPTATGYTVRYQAAPKLITAYRSESL